MLAPAGSDHFAYTDILAKFGIYKALYTYAEPYQHRTNI